MRRFSLIFGVLSVLALAVAACGGEGEQTARGLIIDVHAESILEWESITVRTQVGEELTFSRGKGSTSDSGGHPTCASTCSALCR